MASTRVSARVLPNLAAVKHVDPGSTVSVRVSRGAVAAIHKLDLTASEASGA